MTKKVAFLFPGQGAQYPGMAKDFYDTFSEAKEVFDAADRILRYSLSDLIFNGPMETLTQTRHSQPAIFVSSIAILAVINRHFPALKPFACAGLSLGEYSALCAAGALTFDEALPLVQARAQLMHSACEAHKGTMAVALGLTDEAAMDVVKKAALPNDLWAANFNCPGQVVFSGTSNGIERAIELAKQAGARRVMPLQVHGAFHSGLMQEAADRLEVQLEKTAFKTPSCPVISNVTGDFVTDPAELKGLLKEQVTLPVLWRKGIETLQSSGATLFIEIGCGKVLTGLNKRIGVLGHTLSIEKVSEIENLTQILDKEGD